MAWLNKYKPELACKEEDIEDRFKTGNIIGNLAKGIFGDFVEVATHKGDKLDIAAMIKKTKNEMEKGTEVICEASFSYNGLYCAVDILKKEDDGWSIYEVKSSTMGEKKAIKPIYIADVSYQKYVLENCGVNVKKTYIVALDKGYVRGDTLDIQQLFYISNVDELVAEEIKNVAPTIALADQVLNATEEPSCHLQNHCEDPYKCAYLEYCKKDLPKPCVLDLYKLHGKYKYYNDGVVSFEDILNSDMKLTDIQKRQIDFELNNRDTYINKTEIKKFLEKLWYPLYFLDFESIMPALPLYSGTKPYQQIPFQYSLHYIEKKGGEVKHKEFLEGPGKDPRRDIAECLCRDIPVNACTLVYNKSFECTRLKELANLYDDLSEHLLNIEKNIIDLLLPFQNGFYYNRGMVNGFSIKTVLPAVFPDDPELDYHNLEQIHNGGEAMSIFLKCADMEEKEQARVKKNLLKYCELDTYALVKLWQELVRVTS